MSEELTGPKLDLAVARAMGTLPPEECDGEFEWYGDERESRFGYQCDKCEKFYAADSSDEPMIHAKLPCKKYSTALALLKEMLDWLRAQATEQKTALIIVGSENEWGIAFVCDTKIPALEMLSSGSPGIQAAVALAVDAAGERKSGHNRKI